MTDFIEVYDNALASDFCNDFIDEFEKSKHLNIGTTSGGIDLKKKNSHDLYLNKHPEYSKHLNYIKDSTIRHLLQYVEQYFFMIVGTFSLKVYHPRTKEVVELTPDNFNEVGKPQLLQLMPKLFRIGNFQAQRYFAKKGGYPYWHSEVYPQPKENDSLHRVLLVMFYLNNIEHGGETEFFYQNKKILPSTGRMVIAPAYFTHTHRGCIPKSENKYILTSWILFNRAEQIYS